MGAVSVTTKSSCVASGGGAQQRDGELVALRSESQDKAMV